MPIAFQGEITIVRGRIATLDPKPGAIVLRLDGRRVEFPDAWAFPGLVDAHAHVVGLGLVQREGYLRGIASKEECIKRVRSARTQRGEWIVARGWNHELWSPPALPSAADLDPAFPDVPVALKRVDGHALWVNSRALEIASIHAATPDPPGGAILRSDDGQPTGILLDTAMELVERFIPPPSLDDIERAILIATELCSRAGLTEIHDMDVEPSHLPIFTTLAENGRLHCRILSWVRGQNQEWHTAGVLPTVGELHRVVGVKLFADGALGSRGGALLEPYSDDPTTSGLLLLDRETIVARIERALDDGFASIAVHAIGDRAVRVVLDAFEEIRRRYPHSDDVRLRIEHSQIVHPDDLPRYVSAGAIASVQPIHCTSDAAMAQRRLGDRTRNAYRWRSFLDHGVLICAGSDFPVESHDPLLGIEAFCRRIPPGFDTAWHPDERLSRSDALDAYTIGAHRAADTSYRRGRIAVGLDADITIVARDLETCPDDEITATRTFATVVAGTLYLHE